MSKNETVWRGDFVTDQSEKWNERKSCGIKVSISSLEASKSNESTFNWGQDTQAVQLTRYPKTALKITDEDGKKVNLNKYLKNSQVLSVAWEERDSNLVSYLGHGQDRSIGYLKPGREDLTPVVLVVTEVENRLKLVGFCVDNPLDHEEQDKVTIFRTFHSLLMSGVRQRESEVEDRDMQILQNNACRSAEDQIIRQEKICENQLDNYQTADTKDYQATQKYHLLQHQKSIHEGIRYKCDKCEYQATQKSNLRTHQKSIHEGIRYKCNKCDYQATQKNNLLQHQKSKHEGIRFSCDNCDYQATQKHHLLMHQKSKHEGIRYKCDQCDYQATQKSHLRRHQKSEHEGIRYKCDQCEYQATQQINLLRHQKIKHEGIRFSCDKCDYQATRKDHLLMHQKSEHEGTRYKCEQCDYQATHKRNLRAHQKSKHEGIRYKCNQCDYQATQKSNLLRHQKSNHYVKE